MTEAGPLDQIDDDDDNDKNDNESLSLPGVLKGKYDNSNCFLVQCDQYLTSRYNQ